MSVSDDNGKKEDKDGASSPTPKKSTPRREGGQDVSRVLKTVYDDTLREDVPKELRDLLDKLD